VRKTAFYATHADGRRFRWTFWRENGGWWMKTHDGTTRYGAHNWTAFVPFVHLIAGNYGATTAVS